MGLMTAAGWDFYRNEWWHYQLFDARRYPLVSDADLPRPLVYHRPGPGTPHALPEGCASRRPAICAEGRDSL